MYAEYIDLGCSNNMGLLCIPDALVVTLFWHKPLGPCWVVSCVLGISICQASAVCVLLSLEHFQFLLPACFPYCHRGHLYARSKSETIACNSD